MSANPTLHPISGGILAGGRSSRMGRDKAFLPYAGTTLIHRQAALLSQLGIHDLIISGRPDVAYDVPAARVVTDTIADSGPLAGLAAILEAARHPLVLVVAVDLPHLTPTYLQHLLSLGHPVVPRHANAYEPLVAIYPRTLLPVLKAALTEGRLSLQKLIHSAVTDGLLQTIPIPPNELNQFTNWNTPEDTLR